MSSAEQEGLLGSVTETRTGASSHVIPGRQQMGWGTNVEGSSNVRVCLSVVKWLVQNHNRNYASRHVVAEAEASKWYECHLCMYE